MHSRKGVSIEMFMGLARIILLMHSRKGVSIEMIHNKFFNQNDDALPQGSEY